MAINKFQVSIIALINVISAIYSYICLTEYDKFYSSFSTDPSKLWLSLIFMSIVSGLVAIYFVLMVLYGVICTCLTGDNTNQKPSFSLCGCFSLIIYVLSYFWGWILYLNISESVKSLIIWKAFVFQIYTPIIIIGISFLFFIIRYFCSDDKKKEEYIKYQDNFNPNV